MASVVSLNWRADWINFSESAKFWDSEMFEILYPAMVVDSILSVLWWLLTLAIFRLWFRPPQDVYVLAILNLRIPCLRPETLARSLLTNHEGREQEMGPRGFKDGNEGFKYPLRRGRQRPEESCWTDISWFNGYVFLFSQNVSGKLVIIKNVFQICIHSIQNSFWHFSDAGLTMFYLMINCIKMLTKKMKIIQDQKMTKNTFTVSCIQKSHIKFCIFKKKNAGAM